MILHLISSEGFYGAENMVLNLMAALRAKGCDSSLGVFLNAHRPHSEIAQRAREKGFTTDIIPCGGRLDRKAISAIRDLRVGPVRVRSEEHTSELQSHSDLVCRLLLEKKKK